MWLHYFNKKNNHPIRDGHSRSSIDDSSFLKRTLISKNKSDSFIIRLNDNSNLNNKSIKQYHRLNSLNSHRDIISMTSAITTTLTRHRHPLNPTMKILTITTIILVLFQKLDMTLLPSSIMVTAVPIINEKNNFTLIKNRYIDNIHENNNDEHSSLILQQQSMINLNNNDSENLIQTIFDTEKRPEQQLNIHNIDVVDRMESSKQISIKKKDDKRHRYNPWIGRIKRSGIADQRLAELLELARMDVIRKLARDNSHLMGEGVAYGLIDPHIIGRRRRRRRDLMDQQKQQEVEELGRLVNNLLRQQITNQHRLQSNRYQKRMKLMDDSKTFLKNLRKNNLILTEIENIEEPIETRKQCSSSLLFSWLWPTLIQEDQNQLKSLSDNINKNKFDHQQTLNQLIKYISQED